jgi:DNA primase
MNTHLGSFSFFTIPLIIYSLNPIDMATRNISIAETKQIDMVDFLKTLGYTPQKIRNSDHWYLSPLREEKSPSFKVNRQLNVWYDHGTGVGGNLIDFGIRYFKCSVAELLQKISQQQSPSFSFHPLSYKQAGEKKKPSHQAGKIRIISSREISNPALQEYLDARQIPLAIASQFCEEISFELYGKKHLAIGF